MDRGAGLGLLGTKLPGPGTIYLGQDLRFLKPVGPGDTVTATVTVKSKEGPERAVVLDAACFNQRGDARVAAFVISTDEEAAIAEDALALVSSAG